MSETILKVSGSVRLTEIHPFWLPGDGSPLPPEDLEDLIARSHARVRMVTSNLLVETGRSLISRLMGFAYNAPTVSDVAASATFPVNTVDDLRITTMKFGLQPSPTAPASTDTALEGSVYYSSQLLLVSHPDTMSVRWSGIIPAGTGDGEVFTEEGLFASNGAMLARTTFSQTKTVGQAAQYDHTFNITAT